MSEVKSVKNLDRHLQRVKLLLHHLDEQTHGWAGVLTSALGEALKPSTAIIAAAIAYFALFSIFPLILLAISIASYNLNPSVGWRIIFDLLEFIAPALDELLGQNIGNIIRTRGPVTGVALVGLLWAASTVFYTLTSSLNAIWGHQKTRAVWKRRGLSILFVLAFIGPVLFLASVTGSMMDNVRTWLPEQFPFIGPGISFLVAVLLDVVMLLVLYLLLPHGAATWRELLPGAMGAGILWELAKKGFLLFVSTYLTASNVIYGSVATITAFLTWAYLSGLIFLFGAFISLEYFNLKQRLQAAAEDTRMGFTSE